MTAHARTPRQLLALILAFALLLPAATVLTSVATEAPASAGINVDRQKTVQKRGVPFQRSVNQNIRGSNLPVCTVPYSSCGEIGFVPVVKNFPGVPNGRVKIQFKS